MTPDAIRNLQASLRLPTTGVFDSATSTALNAAVTKAVSKNRDVQRYSGTNSVNSILNAYVNNGLLGVRDLTGKSFTKKEQEGAVKKAERALAPAYKAQVAFETAGVEDSLRAEQESFTQFQDAEAESFGDNKKALDANAVDQGILFSGARVQKNNDLRNTFDDREALRRGQGADRMATVARGQQYNYGNDAARKLSNLYQLPGHSSFDQNSAQGNVTRSSSLSSAYDPGQFNFQGVKPVNQKAQVQTRAAGLLANRANKMSLSGIGAKF